MADEPKLLHETDKLSPWEPDRDPVNLAVLGKLAEELGEAVAAVSRCIIQGIDEAEPVTGIVNREWLESELADVLAGISITMRHFNLDDDRMQARTTRKITHLKMWHDRIRGMYGRRP